MFRSNNATIQPQQSPCEDRKVEVSIESGGDGEQVVLRYSTWTEGLGWCSQKTIRLEASQLDEVHRALTVARHRLGRQRAAVGQSTEPAQIIQLPSVITN